MRKHCVAAWQASYSIKTWARHRYDQRDSRYKKSQLPQGMVTSYFSRPAVLLLFWPEKIQLITFLEKQVCSNRNIQLCGKKSGEQTGGSQLGETTISQKIRNFHCMMFELKKRSGNFVWTKFACSDYRSAFGHMVGPRKKMNSRHILLWPKSLKMAKRKRSLSREKWGAILPEGLRVPGGSLFKIKILYLI